MWRVRAIFIFFLLWFFCILLRLFYWQVYSHERLLALAQQQQSFRLEIPAARGEILSADKSPLVTNQTAYLLYAEPKKIKDPTNTAHTLSVILQKDEASIAAQISLPLYWVPLQHRLSKEAAEKIKAANIQAINFEREDIRYYPEGSISAHLLGFVGSAYDGSPKGYFGLEGYYDRELQGRFGLLRQNKDAHGDPILMGIGDRVLPESGKKLQLYIDRSIQYIIEKQLREGVERYGAKGGTVTVLDPQTGGILGLAAFPSYDPRFFNDYPKELYKNPVISETYEPGSTFKTLIIAVALEHGLIDENTVFSEAGPIEIDGYQIRTWNNKYSGMITTKQILERSSNVGMVAIAKKIGRERMVKAIKDFGFGKPTGVDLEEEISPELRADGEWHAIDLATASFGQGIAVTPLQMVRAVASIANNGKLLVPHVVAKIVDQNDRVISIKPVLTRQVIHKETAKVLTEMMVQAVDNGEARFAKPTGYSIAGKTGTAQIPLAGHYELEKTIASFIGFAPSKDPKFVMLVTLREPTTSPWGSETAAPLFFSISKELFGYYGIHPSL